MYLVAGTHSVACAASGACDLTGTGFLAGACVFHCIAGTYLVTGTYRAAHNRARLTVHFAGTVVVVL